MSLSTIFTFISLLLWLSRHLYRNLTHSHSSPPFPPGPKPLPVLGNLFDIPASRDYITYSHWGQEYGDVVHVSALGHHIIVLNSIEATDALFGHRSAIYSDRPLIPMIHDPKLMDSGWAFILMPYSPTWKRHRRLFSQHLAATETLLAQQTKSTHTLLRSILRMPSEYLAHIRHAAADVILRTTYGYDIKPTHDPFVELMERFSKEVLQDAIPGPYLVNYFPWLKYVPSWFPGAGFKTFAREARNLSKELVRLPFEDLQKRMAEGTAPTSFAGSALADLTDDSPPQLLQDIKEVSATMYITSADTSVSTLHFCILALVLNPSTQRRAHTELDTVLGDPASPTFRLPTFHDRPRLPYIDAILKESLRWMNAVVTGIPHTTTQEDVYRGWRIPKGAIVIANSWGLLHDEKRYTNPSTFHPERFIKTESRDAEPDPARFGVFGYGRRVCPGRHVADTLLWIEIASLLAVFTFTPATDKQGNPIDVAYARTPLPGLLLHPQPFPCAITPRSSEAVARILETDGSIDI